LICFLFQGEVTHSFGAAEGNFHVFFTARFCNHATIRKHGRNG